MKSFFKKLAGFRSRLTRLNDNEPVAKLALAVIIILDAFILSIIFGGLEEHTNQLTSPDEYFPWECRQIFITKDWTDANKTAKLQQLILADYNNYSYQYNSPLEKSKIGRMHPLCGEVYGKIRLIAEKNELKDLFISRQQAAKKKDQLVGQYDRENEVYDTQLLENIAGVEGREAGGTGEALKGKAKEIDRLNTQIKETDRKINSDPLVAEFWALTRLGDEALREKLVHDLNRFERIYLFKELLWQLLFLIPLLAVFCVWHSKSVKNARAIQGLVSGHLIVVASIPVVIKVAQTVLDLIPYHFFKSLFALLEKLHIIALWHYLVIIISIVVALAVVFIIQKKLFNKARLQEKRLAKGACYSCGKTLPDKRAAACPFCGVKQMQKCSACGSDTFVHGKFCACCGQDLRSQIL